MLPGSTLSDILDESASSFNYRKSFHSKIFFFSDIKRRLISSGFIHHIQSSFVFSSLVDKPDVGPNILESVLMSYLLVVNQQAYIPSKQAASLTVQQETNRSDILKTLNMLLDTFEPYFIWEFLTKNFDSIVTEQRDQFFITAGATIEQLCGVIQMLLDIASLESSTDIQSEHLPEMLYRLIKTMNNNIGKFSADQLTLCMEVLLKILKKVVPTDTTHRLSIFRRSTSDDILSLSEQKNDTESLFTDTISDSSTEDDEEEISEHVLNEQHEFTETTVQSMNNGEEKSDQDVRRLLRQMVRKVEKHLIRQSSNENRKVLDEPRPKLITKTMLQSMNHLEKSITLYKIFFHRFITTFLIDTSKTSLNEKFLNIYSLTQKKTNENILALFNRYQQQIDFQIKLQDQVDHYKRAFDDCCKLLIEFCCFPRQANLANQTALSKGEFKSRCVKYS